LTFVLDWILGKVHMSASYSKEELKQLVKTHGSDETGEEEEDPFHYCQKFFDTPIERFIETPISSFQDDYFGVQEDELVGVCLRRLYLSGEETRSFMVLGKENGEVLGYTTEEFIMGLFQPFSH